MCTVSQHRTQITDCSITGRNCSSSSNSSSSSSSRNHISSSSCSSSRSSSSSSSNSSRNNNRSSTGSNNKNNSSCNEMVYLTTHLTHFIYGYMASDHSEETHCRHMGYSFRLAARVLLYAPSHRQDSTYHGLC